MSNRLASSTQDVRELAVPETEVYANQVARLGLRPPKGVLRVSGRHEWNTWFVPAEKIEFEADAELVFTRQALANPELYVLAREIVSLDLQKPGKITWERSPNATPSDRGAAQPGVHAREDGANGGSGQPGAEGIVGENGELAPTLTVVVHRTATPLLVDLAGEAGGPGGAGQTGGNGGAGAKGTPASQTAFGCRAGGGNGGTGGAGGAGGVGGTGGSGGKGGAFTLITTDDNYAVASRMLRVELTGGAGGSGGQAGEGGRGGPGGPGGQEARPFCGGGSAGNGGPNGRKGDPGRSGAQGPAGMFRVGALSAADIDRLYRQ